MTIEQEAELAQRRLRNAIACDGGEVRLTDAEREAMEWVIARIIDFSSSRDEDKKAAVLRGLLDRLGGER